MKFFLLPQLFGVNKEHCETYPLGKYMIWMSAINTINFVFILLFLFKRLLKSKNSRKVLFAIK